MINYLLRMFKNIKAVRSQRGIDCAIAGHLNEVVKLLPASPSTDLDKKITDLVFEARDLTLQKTGGFMTQFVTRH